MGQPIRAGRQSWDVNPGPPEAKSCALSAKPLSTWGGRRPRSPPRPTEIAAAPDPERAAQVLPLGDHTRWRTAIVMVPFCS